MSTINLIKKVSIICSVVIIGAIGGYGIYEYVTKEVIKPSTVIFVFLGIGFLFQSITWGDIDGKHEGKKDKLEKHITQLSYKISYYLILLSMFIVLVVSDRVTSMEDIKNIPLVIVLGLAWIIMPITEFFVSKKYR